MKGSKLILGSIILLFAMLWLPMGQYDFLIDHWMKIGTYALPFLLIGAFSLNRNGEFKNLNKDYRFISIIMLIAYIVHQYEEHWIDLFGNYYSFYVFNNKFILGNLGATGSAIKPLTKEAIFVINTSLVWLVGVLAILRAPKHIFPLIAMASIIIVNGFVHILAGVIKFEYNPGMFTSVVIFVPIYITFVRYLIKQSKHYIKQIFGGIVWSLLAHVIMVSGLLMANWFNIFPEFVYFIGLVIWSVIPLGLYRNKIRMQVE
ncbi:HXXEE domain-containing protein [Marinifilum caeruleilacunae]|uniref:HXXEE domain-containing protein n=1 Tax=Marinifilum caeruleilacunae TaxID=2499076 RepID=A0ABX1X112_9BACT|nr:HXXEE domain-containing protein [Marinifilum caeruleilacunae]NOU61774.1 HXXEE domain-containing protein [Marinifilum caeruleilacunae]